MPKSWAVNPCECPAKSSSKDLKCAPIPNKAKEVETHSAKVSTCGDDGQNFLEEVIEKFTEGPTSNGITLEPKSNAEVLDYISCYRKSTSTFCAYKNNLATYIQLASEESGLPFAALSCLYFRESQFDAKVVSRTGALSLVQMLPSAVQETDLILDKAADTYRSRIIKLLRMSKTVRSKNKSSKDMIEMLNAEMQSIQKKLKQPKTQKLSLYPLLSESFVELQQRLQDLEESIDDELGSVETPKSCDDECFQEQVKPLIEEAFLVEDQMMMFKRQLQSGLGMPESAAYKASAKYNENMSAIKSEFDRDQAHYRARKFWDRYWEGTKGAPQAILPKPLTDSEKKRALAKKAAACPQIAFVMSAMKLVKEVSLLYPESGEILDDRQRLQFTIDGVQMDPTESGTLMAGIYNMGTGDYSKYCKKFTTLMDCLASLDEKKKAFEKKGKKQEAKSMAEKLGQMKSVKNCAEKGNQQPPEGTEARQCDQKRCTE
jgi:hypothetical protein